MTTTIQRPYLKSIFLLLTFIITFSACKNSDKKKAQEKEELVSENTFIPNPVQLEKQEVKTLEIGATAPDFSLPNVDGEFYSLKNFSDAEILVMVFTCNHCPTAEAYEDRIIDFTKEYKDKNVSVVAIMPNSVLGLLLEECGYSEINDSYDEMKMRYKDKAFNFPYLYDGDNQATSLKYGPKTTPHVFVFDKERILRYQGRIDASEKPGTGNSEDLKLAVDELLAGKEVSNPKTKAFGCSTKWSWKADSAVRVNAEWAAREVTLEEINDAGVKELLANNDSGKLRLINLWATWCAPCVIEYPEFVKIHRMYGKRDFEFVSISIDKIGRKERVHKFLDESNSAVKNYIYSEKDVYNFIELINPEWGGALPYTLLIEPGGKVVYSYQGEVDLMELKKTIVEHDMMGRFYKDR